MTSLPAPVEAAAARARGAGFGLSCEPEVGRLLAVLAAAVPEGGRIAELGTGCGVGTAWMVWGLGPRTDATIVTVEANALSATVARAGEWPSFVTLLHGDALEETSEKGPYDLVFADCPAGKWWGLDEVVARIRPGGLYVVDDMVVAADPSNEYHERMVTARDAIVGHPQLVTAELGFGSGMILGARKR